MTRLGALLAIAGFLMLSGCEEEVWAAEMQCGAPDTMLKALKDAYSEAPAFTGEAPTGAAITVTVSPTGSWTALIAMGDKLCVFAGGEKWTAVDAAPVKPAPGSLPEAPALLKHDLILIRN